MDPYEVGKHAFHSGDVGFLYTEERASERMTRPSSEATNYLNYIKPDAITSLIQPLSKEHDEHLFIVTHQSFELWFKQSIYELNTCQKIFEELISVTPESDEEKEGMTKILKYMRRADKIIRYATGAFDILDTMDGADFLDFRDSLGDGSGFQSTQFRELEYLLGVTSRPHVVSKKTGKRMKLEEKYAEMECPYFAKRIDEFKERVSLKSTVYQWIHRIKIDNLDDFIKFVLSKKVSTSNPRDDPTSFFFNDTDTDEVLHFRKASLFLLTYRNHHRWYLYAQILQSLQKLEQALVIWKHRHPRTVEITIGRRVGTGGSSGVAYLDSTSMPQYRIFSDLIRVRGESISQHKLGELSKDGIWKKSEE